MFGARLPISICTAALLAAGAAHAADYSQPIYVSPQQQPVYVQPPPVIESPIGDWYLRGFVGVGKNGTPSLDYLPAPGNVGNGFVFDQHSIADTTFIGLGVGYEWNNWLRFDVTGEYRGKTQVNARGVYDPVLGTGDAYQGYIKSWVLLANGFVDLGTWNCFTPFVGAGIGGAYNQLANFVDMGIGTTGAGFGRNTSEWHMAYALYAGIGYAVSKNLKVDFTYRYLNYGSITDTVDCIGGCVADSYKFGNLHSHDFMIGLRWTCCDVPPPPVYQPPLRSKG
jgi:opacity protein-like surface antigen